MKLFELVGVKKYHKFNEWQLKKLLRRMGIECIGAGAYGQVFSHPKWDYVVKVFEDGPYLDFVNYALAHPNKHFPLFKRKPLEMHKFHTRVKNGGHKFWLVKIEKLNPITDKKLLKSIVENLEPLSYMDAQGMEYKTENHALLLPTGEWKTNYSRNDLIKDYPWFKTLAEAYREFVTSEHATGSPDIHAGNFMQRNDGTIVIIDPQWIGTNPYKEYDEWMKRETDYYANYEPEMTSGPRYKHQIDDEKREEVKRKLTQQILQHFGVDVDDDIPF